MQRHLLITAKRIQLDALDAKAATQRSVQRVLLVDFRLGLSCLEKKPKRSPAFHSDTRASLSCTAAIDFSISISLIREATRDANS